MQIFRLEGKGLKELHAISTQIDKKPSCR